MTNKEWREAVEIRYSKALYLGFGRSDFYHFLYGYKRIFIEVLKSFVYIFLSLGAFGQRKGRSVSLYVTKNQRKAIDRLTMVGVDCGCVIPLYKLSVTANVLRFFVWVSKLVLFPFCFLTARHREGAYFSSLAYGMRLYAKVLGMELSRAGVERVCISNDHAGDIYLLTLALRDIPSVYVIYVQHGAVKPEFPVNYFDLIYVYSEQYVDVYKKLSLNPQVVIVVIPESVGSRAGLSNLDFLVCFSHSFRLVNSVKLMRLFKSRAPISVGVRFHPSDRFALIKYRLLALFYPVELSPDLLSFEADSMRADRLICASSSLLLDVFNSSYANKLIWLKSIGLEWDYYDLSDKICTISSVGELDAVLCMQS